MKCVEGPPALHGMLAPRIERPGCPGTALP